MFSYNVDGEEGYLINPRLAACDGHQDDLEGCLSIPGLYLPTPRAGHAVATGVDLDGQPVTVEGTGVLARCLQHEVDHLDGHLFLDRLPDGERRQALRALRGQLGPPGPAERPVSGSAAGRGTAGAADLPEFSEQAAQPFEGRLGGVVVAQHAELVEQPVIGAVRVAQGEQLPVRDVQLLPPACTARTMVSSTSACCSGLRPGPVGQPFSQIRMGIPGQDRRSAGPPPGNCAAAS